jgi:NAD-dependent dihydropyrimidine dehydrogenase PreA subunit
MDTSERGVTRPVVDHGRCEGKQACVAVCPEDVFEVRRIDDADFARLPLLGRLRSVMHDRMTSYPVAADRCNACGRCVDACPEKAITLAAHEPASRPATFGVG